MPARSVTECQPTLALHELPHGNLTSASISLLMELPSSSVYECKNALHYVQANFTYLIPHT